MFSDDPDKTLFKQPKPGGDRTVIRPTPGGRGASAQEPPMPRSQPQGQAQPQQPLPRRPVQPGMDVEAAYSRMSAGLNPLVNSASTLIAVFEKTKQSLSHPDVGGLHQRLVNEIKTFEMRANEQGIAKEVVLSARYLLCSVIDEAILNTPWGSDSPWAQRTLLTVFHNETSGGEKSFIIIDRMKERPAENIDILELCYICLSLGFEGKYRLMHRGRDTLEQIRDELFRIIRNQRGEYERTLSPSWEGLGKTRNTLSEYIPMWVVVSCVAVILFFSYSGFRYWLYQSSTPVAEKLSEISKPEEIIKIK
ncbi:MAG: type VI secretion system protein ImpK [Cellvibrionaceae bacterium]|jgi:type VI secretion system protein ImpK